MDLSGRPFGHQFSQNASGIQKTMLKRRASVNKNEQDPGKAGTHNSGLIQKSGF